MLGGMMQSIGVGGTVEASELNLLTDAYIYDSTRAKNFRIRRELAYTTLDGGAELLNYNAGQHAFLIELSEKMRIDSSGNVGIGTSSPSAKLDITSTTSGFLPPRMTAIQRDAIGTPATGLVIYNTTTNVLNFYNGTSWGAV